MEGMSSRKLKERTRLESMTTLPSWTFLSNHGHVLVHLHRSPDSLIREIAVAVGITERSAQGILGDLHDAGYVSIKKIGRRNRYQVNPNKRFRHPSEASESIGSLLKIFS